MFGDLRRARLIPLVLSFVGSVACSETESPTEPSETPTSETVFSVLVPESLTLGVGDTLQIRAVAFLKDGTRQILTSSASWQSSNAGVASVSPSGVVTGVGAGEADIVVTLDGMHGTSALTVSNEFSPTPTFLGTVAGPENEVGTLVISRRETARTTGSLYLSRGLIDLYGRIDEPTGIVNIAGGGFTFLGSLTGAVLAGTYTGVSGASGGFAAVDATHMAATPFCGSYSSEGGTPLGNADTGAFVLTIARDNTVVGAFVPADASRLPVSLLGRRDEDAVQLTTSLKTAVTGTLLNGVVTGRFETSTRSLASFTASTASCW